MTNKAKIIIDARGAELPAGRHLVDLVVEINTTGMTPGRYLARAKFVAVVGADGHGEDTSPLRLDLVPPGSHTGTFPITLTY